MPTTLRDLRIRAKLTQAQLAAAVGTTQASVSRWEASAYRPRWMSRKPLQAALGCTEDELDAVIERRPV